ncbi:NAD-dependent epimerase/dehydratase family protein [uncultured Deinococcus sp.]|uniref:NAD-dependent epimerase/dehydratase family protein n=1 Tax=uncultured Deinococcus sp. TaxID=158789 RepID=UPI00258AB4B0|nr:NAD-dependent epimerase/dehydratase family protein [uncultured Deinococcus sp.]
MTRLLITGGLGFIGSHVAEQALERGIEVAVFDNLSSGRRENVPGAVRVYEADLRDEAAVSAAVADFAPDWISHHAAQASVPGSLRDPGHDASVNVLGTLNLLEAARRGGVRRVVFASTGGAIYGEVPDHEVGQVGGPLRPFTPYAVSKLAGEQYLEVYRRHFGLESVTLRYSNVYGERQSIHGEAGVVAAFCEALLRGGPLRVNGRHEAGDRGCVRDYVYVGDVARANLLALEGRLDPARPVLDVGTGVGTDSRALAETLLRASGSRAAVESGPPRAGDVGRSVLSAEALRTLLGDLTPLETGLARTLAWYRQEAVPG